MLSARLEKAGAQLIDDGGLRMVSEKTTSRALCRASQLDSFGVEDQEGVEALSDATACQG